jgi:hypothetical protein
MGNKAMTPSEIELTASLIHRYRHLRGAMVELPKKEDVDLLALKITYIGREMLIWVVRISSLATAFPNFLLELLNVPQIRNMHKFTE